jgi:hypothetical protein
MDTQLSLDDQFIVSPEALFERLGDEGVILDTRTDIYFGLNATGRYVWETIAGGQSLNDAALRLVDQFAIPLNTARADTLAVVEELLHRQLIRPAEPR